jgi:YegS/Rv2252/BmrU family lipid kinase
MEKMCWKTCIRYHNYFCTGFHRSFDFFISSLVVYFCNTLFDLKTRIEFIINPISGGIKKQSLPDYILSHTDKSLYDIHCTFTQSAQHTKVLAREAVCNNADIVVAAGGDGTINNVAEALAGSQVKLGLMPLGSGNGLARHLHIPCDKKQALELITGNHALKKLDTGTANSHFFVNVAGVGFDAHVSGKFAIAPKRGFISYAKITLAEFASYKSRTYRLTIDGNKHTLDAFLLCVANGSQYGNNAYIAPEALPDDGLFHITVLKPFRILDMPAIGYHLFAKTLHKSRYVACFTGRHIYIDRPSAELMNIDGEPVHADSSIDIRLMPSQLKIIVPV